MKTTMTPRTPEQRRAILAYAEKYGTGKAARKFKISPPSIHNWRRAERAALVASEPTTVAASEKIDMHWMNEEQIKQAVKWAFWGYQQAMNGNGKG